MLIDDQEEILQYVEEILDEKYAVLCALNGRGGYKKAQDELPNLLICDALMPGMSDLKVSHVFRSDLTTSQIPTVVPTTRADRASRMPGWEVVVDDYMQRSFESEELVLRVTGLLSIRKALRQSAANKYSEAQPLSEQNNYTAKDRAFLKRLEHVIYTNFDNENFGRESMAKEMCLSGRQLQRKLKVLVDQNPSEYLRNYRLAKSAESIKKGAQIGTVALECGFRSASYFTKCFRQHYGVLPKDYRTQNVHRSNLQ